MRLLLLLLQLLLQTVDLVHAGRVIRLVHMQNASPFRVDTARQSGRRPRALSPRRRGKMIALSTVPSSIRLKALDAAVLYADCRRATRRPGRLPKAAERPAVVVRTAGRRHSVGLTLEGAAEPAWHPQCRQRYSRCHIRPQ